MSSPVCSPIVWCFPYWPFKYGSSPGVSRLRPHLGSLAILMLEHQVQQLHHGCCTMCENVTYFGLQQSSPACGVSSTWFSPTSARQKALNSTAVTCAISRQSVRFHIAPCPFGLGKEVGHLPLHLISRVSATSSKSAGSPSCVSGWFLWLCIGCELS